MVPSMACLTVNVPEEKTEERSLPLARGPTCLQRAAATFSYYLENLGAHLTDGWRPVEWERFQLLSHYLPSRVVW